MIDPRVVSSGIQAGRSLAPQGPPIQEMLGMKMQNNQMIAEIMQSLLKQHMSDVGDLRKMQMNLYYKALTDQDVLDPAERQKNADNILSMDMSRFLGFNSMLKGGFGGKDTTESNESMSTGANLLNVNRGTFMGMDKQNLINMSSKFPENTLRTGVSPQKMIKTGAQFANRTPYGTGASSLLANYTPATSNIPTAGQSTKLQRNIRTGEYRVVPR